MEIQQKKEMNREYTQFLGGEIQMEDYSVQMVLHHLPEGLLYSSVLTMNKERIWSCEHTGKQRLSEYCERKSLGSEELRWIFGGILNNLKEAQEFLLNANHLYLKPEEVYLSSAKERIWNCFVPFYEKDIWKSLLELSQYLLGHLDQREQKAMQIAYGLYRYLAQGGSNIEEIWEILCEREVQDEAADKAQEIKYAEESSHKDETGWEFGEKVLEPSAEGNTEKRVRTKEFPLVGWFLMGLSGVAAVFLFAYVALNEWYLSNAMKIVILILAIGFGCAGILIWKRLSPRLKKKKLLEDEGEENGTVIKKRRKDDSERGDFGQDGFGREDFGRGELGRDEFRREDFMRDGVDQEDFDMGMTQVLRGESPLVRLVRIDNGDTITVPNFPAVIGKIPEKVQIQILEPAVSRIHGRLICENGEYYLEDLYSMNGTYVNGIRLEPQKPVHLKAEDILVFANISYYFRL